MELTASAQVNIAPNYVEFLALRIDNPEVVNYFKSLSPIDYAGEATKMVEIGATVLNRVKSSQDMDYINKKIAEIFLKVNQQFYEFNTQMREMLESSLSPVQAGSFMHQANALIAAQGDTVKENLIAIVRDAQQNIIRETEKLENGCVALDRRMDPNNTASYLAIIARRIEAFEKTLESQFLETDSASFVGKLKSVVDEHFGNDGKVLSLIEKKLELDAEGRTPLGHMYLNLKGEITSLRDAVMKLIGQKELIDETTKKGYPFEAIVFEKLQEIAKPFGDIVEDTSLKVVAITGSKKGDYVYTLAKTDTNIVIDAKNYNKLKSLPAMLAYLKEAMKQRGSKIGIIVAPEAKNLQKQIGSWNVYGPCIITPLDHLEVSIKYSKFALQMQDTEHQGINTGLIKHKLDEVQRKMKEISTIKGKLTKLANGVNLSVVELQTILDSLKKDVVEKLSDIENALN
jgi:hypothetical protein